LLLDVTDADTIATTAAAGVPELEPTGQLFSWDGTLVPW
jgi:hypothetical protein